MFPADVTRLSFLALGNAAETSVRLMRGKDGVTVVGRLKEKLENHPDIQWRETDHGFRIEPATKEGFAIELSTQEDQTTVSFADGWHEGFADPNEALACVAFGLSDACRVCVSRRWGRAYKWTVEQVSDRGWAPHSTTGLLLFAFWRRKEVEYLQNHCIANSEEA